MPLHDLPPKYALVAIQGYPDILTYGIDQKKTPEIDIGYEVQIDLRNRLERGWVVDLTDEVQIKKEINSNDKQESLFKEEIKSQVKIKNIVSGHRAFLKKDLNFFKMIAEYYAVNLSEVLENAVPRALDERLNYSFKLSEEINETNINKATEKLKKSPIQKKAFDTICSNNGHLSSSEIDLLPENIKKALKSLEEKNIIFREAEELSNSHKIIPDPVLTEQQRIAVEAINTELDKNCYSPFLLLGITGSGKTEVYIRTIREAIKNGGSALIIVPEIALTPQLVQRFNARLPYKIAILHSQVGAGAKWSEWKKILQGEKQIIIGARSAIFAPINDLKIIVVDEEHESSYKQAEGLRYNARDLALFKAKERSCPVILGSATPSFESLANVKKQNLNLIELTERATNAKLPEIKVVDLKGLSKKFFASPNISIELKNAIDQTLAKGEQIILFYNKRGFASFLQCSHCGKSLECPQCSVTLTYYQQKNKVSCHYCGVSKASPELCPHCHNKDTHSVEEGKKEKSYGKLIPRGSGTEKIFEEIQTLFPDVTVDRMDRESTGQKGSVEEVLQKMQNGSTKILIGTQMLAKGHDIPSVTLVGIIDADVGLHFPDFRSSERTYQLIVQASGRAGRGSLPGKVVIQTRESNHPTIVAAVTNRFKAFARYELDFRKKLDYPPESRLARIIISSTNKQEAANASINLTEFLKNLQAHENNSGISFKILGPSPAPIEKLRGRYRWHILLKCQSAKKLSQIAKEVKTWKNRSKDTLDLRVIVDIDPIDMM